MTEEVQSVAISPWPAPRAVCCTLHLVLFTIGKVVYGHAAAKGL